LLRPRSCRRRAIRPSLYRGCRFVATANRSAPAGIGRAPPK